MIYSHLLLFYYFLNCFSSLITHCLILWYFTWQITCVRMNAICWYQVAVNITHLSLPLGHISIFFFIFICCRLFFSFSITLPSWALTDLTIFLQSEEGLTIMQRVPLTSMCLGIWLTIPCQSFVLSVLNPTAVIPSVIWKAVNSVLETERSYAFIYRAVLFNRRVV